MEIKYSKYKKLSRCVACGSEDLAPLLDLGDQPLANSFHEKNELLENFH